MPASASYGESIELTRHNSLEDQRALQVAMELSLLSFGNNMEHHHMDHSTSPNHHYNTMDHINSLHYADEMRFLAKKSQNMTECVPVPSSEHVAEIVGRQGCKIKALRAKTNTYIKTPVRGEEPVFVVTGRKEDVAAAKREILSAAEHFSQIRASRRSGLVGQCGIVGTTGLVPPPPVPGQVTIQVRVPYRVVGLVVGPKGATIKRIQQQTSTYIVTPSREKEPIFEVTGMPDNVEQAKREIEAHIALRTGLVNVDGSGNELSPDMMHDLAAGLNGLGLGMLGSNLGGAMDNGTSDLMGSLYKSSSALRSAFTGHLNNDVYGVASTGLSNLLGDNAFGLRSQYGAPSASSAAGKIDSELQTLGSGLLNSLYDSDEGIGLGGSDSPTLSHSLIQPNIWSTDFGTGVVGGGSTSSINTNSTASGTSTTSAGGAKRSNSFGFPTSDSEHPPARRISSDPLTAIGSTLNSLSAAFQIRSDSDSGVRDSSASASGSASPAACSPVGSSSNSSTRGSLKRECIMCCEGEMVAALVPCGHKLFCMDCAQRLVPKESSDLAGGECPVCHQAVTQAIRIFS
ncbi:hypothetical protein OUZ56_028867 [Daphnia magna]|uniref:RING-type domain-containing protein n=1 Tax=Daphnia magna TaxID=35525 RepID=A0ABR0B565_9CRUS|nr:hypothetical protein OUZ56_028867 [Daphnia magna]